MTPGPHAAHVGAELDAAHALALDRPGTAYDRAYERAYDAVFPHKEGQLAAGEWLIERLRAGARVLDVGCGTGVPTARQLADAGCDVTGIDISTGLLEMARRKVPTATFLPLDVTDLPDLPDLGAPRRGFDAIVAFFSLLMLPRTEIPAILRRLHELLEPGAYFLLSLREAELDAVPASMLDGPLPATGYPGAELRALVSEAGFEVLDLRHLSYAAANPELPPETQVFVYSRRPGTVRSRR